MGAMPRSLLFMKLSDMRPPKTLRPGLRVGESEAPTKPSLTKPSIGSALSYDCSFILPVPPL